MQTQMELFGRVCPPRLTPLETEIMRAVQRRARGRVMRNVFQMALHNGFDPYQVYHYLKRLRAKGQIAFLYRPGIGPGRKRYCTILVLKGNLMDNEQTRQLLEALRLALQLVPDWEHIDETWPSEIWETKQRIIGILESQGAANG